MRQIKFRAKPLPAEHATREIKIFVTGYYYEDKRGSYIITDDEMWRVDPNSVSQLIATDKSGHEVFEGDYIRYPYLKQSFKANFKHINSILNGTLIKENE